MPSPSSTSELLELVRKSGIIGPESFDLRISDVQGLSGDPVKSAAVLVQKGVITRFQAKLLLTGRYRGFKLGSYVIREQLGQGGMGAVYLAEHEALRRKVALKVLTPPKDDPNARLTTERFLREARSAAALDHPNIVRIHDVCYQGEVQYLALEYVDGQTLEDLLVKGGPIAPARAVGFIAQAAAGLQHAHEKGFVHRDIKPSNLILSKDGTVKLLDMGLARSYSPGDRLTEIMDQGAIVGTADFISPEQAMNSPDIDIRADIYSLGATFFALVAGRPPFSGNTTQKLIQHQMKDAPSLSQFDRTLPPELAAVVAKMLAKKPEKRYTTPADVITALAPWLGEDGRKVAAGLSTSEAAISSVELQNTMSEIATGGSTRRLNKSKRLSDRLGANGKVYAATGAAVAVAAMLVAWAVFGRGDSNAMAAIAPNATVAPSPTPAPPTKPAKTKPVKPVVAPLVSAPRPVAGTVLYRFDVAAFPACRFKTRQHDIIDGSHPGLPTGVGMGCWKAESVGEFVRETIDDRPVLGLASRDGDPTAQLTIEIETALGVKLTPGRSYQVRAEYMTRGDSSATILVQNPDENYSLVGHANLEPTNGTWQTASFGFVRPAKGVARLAVDSNRIATGMTYIRSLELLDAAPAATAANDGAVVFRLAAADLTPVRNTKKGLAVTSGEREVLPSGVYFGAHKAETQGEWRIGLVDGVPAIRFVNLSGPIATQIGVDMEKANGLNVSLTPGKDYTLTVTYKTGGTGQGRVYFQTFNDWLVPANASLPNSNDEWKTVEVTTTRKDRLLRFLVDADGIGEENWLAVKEVVLAEAGSAPKAAAAPSASGPVGKSILANPLKSGQPFRFMHENGMPSLDPTTLLPAGVWAHCWKKESVAEFRGEAIDGRFALGVTNLNDELSSQVIFNIEDVLAVRGRPGQKYRLRLEYRTTNDALGALRVRDAVKYTDLAGPNLASTDGEWKTIEATFTRGTEKLDAVVVNESVGEGNTLFVRSFEIFEDK